MQRSALNLQVVNHRLDHFDGDKLSRRVVVTNLVLWRLRVLRHQGDDDILVQVLRFESAAKKKVVFGSNDE